MKKKRRERVIVAIEISRRQIGDTISVVGKPKVKVSLKNKVEKLKCALISIENSPGIQVLKKSLHYVLEWLVVEKES